MPADGEQRLLAGGPDEAERRCDVQNVGEPLQRVLRTVGKIGVTEESLEQAQARVQPSVGRGGD
jgi:hypothetical protein